MKFQHKNNDIISIWLHFITFNDIFYSLNSRPSSSSLNHLHFKGQRINIEICLIETLLFSAANLKNSHAFEAFAHLLLSEELDAADSPVATIFAVSGAKKRLT